MRSWNTAPILINLVIAIAFNSNYYVGLFRNYPRVPCDGKTKPRKLDALPFCLDRGTTLSRVGELDRFLSDDRSDSPSTRLFFPPVLEMPANKRWGRYYLHDPVCPFLRYPFAHHALCPTIHAALAG
jgi:hypothetical protein